MRVRVRRMPSGVAYVPNQLSVVIVADGEVSALGQDKAVVVEDLIRQGREVLERLRMIFAKSRGEQMIKKNVDEDGSIAAPLVREQVAHEFTSGWVSVKTSMRRCREKPA